MSLINILFWVVMVGASIMSAGGLLWLAMHRSARQ
jgi:hypothetical protein